MNLSAVDVLVFIGFLGLVVGVSLYASRKKKTTEGYFLAGRELTWWLIGVSMVAANISTEQFVGMSGAGFGRLGLAVASWEWMAAAAMAIVALLFLPKYLKMGVYTMPEFLEYRYGPLARTMLAVFNVGIAITVTSGMILYSGAITLKTLFGMNIYVSVWLLGIIAAIYTMYGGLKAVVWADFIQGIGLIVGGALVFFLGLNAVGGLGNFLNQSADKLHAVLPADDPDMPWTAVLIGGIWVPNLTYWGCYQYITQKTLASRSLAHGQKGVLFAAFLKLLMPFIVVFPGIMAYQLYRNEISSPDMAYPYLMQKVLPAGLRGVIFATLCGAIMSSLDSLLNAMSTIVTMDLYKRLWKKDKPDEHYVKVGRIATVLIVIAGCLYAPLMQKSQGMFMTLQEVGGLFAPGICAAFLFGLFWKRTARAAGAGALMLSVPVYGLFFFLQKFKVIAPMPFLHRIGLTFLIICACVVILTLIQPQKDCSAAHKSNLDMHSPLSVKILAALVMLVIAALYMVFR